MFLQLRIPASLGVRVVIAVCLLIGWVILAQYILPLPPFPTMKPVMLPLSGCSLGHVHRHLGMKEGLGELS